MGDDRETWKPFVVGDSATTAHLKGALARANERAAIKRVEQELVARVITRAPTKTPTKGSIF